MGKELTEQQKKDARDRFIQETNECLTEIGKELESENQIRFNLAKVLDEELRYDATDEHGQPELDEQGNPVVYVIKGLNEYEQLAKIKRNNNAENNAEHNVNENNNVNENAGVINNQHQKKIKATDFLSMRKGQPLEEVDRDTEAHFRLYCLTHGVTREDMDELGKENPSDEVLTKIRALKKPYYDMIYKKDTKEITKMYVDYCGMIAPILPKMVKCTSPRGLKDLMPDMYMFHDMCSFFSQTLQLGNAHPDAMKKKLVQDVDNELKARHYNFTMEDIYNYAYPVSVTMGQAEVWYYQPQRPKSLDAKGILTDEYWDNVKNQDQRDRQVVQSMLYMAEATQKAIDLAREKKQDPAHFMPRKYLQPLERELGMSLDANPDLDRIENIIEGSEIKRQELQEEKDNEKIVRRLKSGLMSAIGLELSSLPADRELRTPEMKDAGNLQDFINGDYAAYGTLPQAYRNYHMTTVMNKLDKKFGRTGKMSLDDPNDHSFKDYLDQNLLCPGFQSAIELYKSELLNRKDEESEKLAAKCGEALVYMNEKVMQNTLAPIDADKKNDILDPDNANKITEEDIIRNREKQGVMATTFVLAHLGGVTLNASEEQVKYKGTVADLYAHGSRTMYSLPKGNNGDRFEDAIFGTVDPKLNKVVHYRTVSTHSVKVHEGDDNQYLEEKKVGFSITKNKGMNIAVGGLGNTFGPNSSWTIREKGKDGHALFKYANPTQNDIGYMMLGIESASSNNTSRIGGKHNAAAKRSPLSPFGATKHLPGASYGGRMVDLQNINQDALLHFITDFKQKYVALQKKAGEYTAREEDEVVQPEHMNNGEDQHEDALQQVNAAAQQANAEALEAKQRLEKVNKCLCGSMLSAKDLKLVLGANGLGMNEEYLGAIFSPNLQRANANQNENHQNQNENLENQNENRQNQNENLENQNENLENQNEHADQENPVDDRNLDQIFVQQERAVQEDQKTHIMVPPAMEFYKDRFEALKKKIKQSPDAKMIRQLIERVTEEKENNIPSRYGKSLKDIQDAVDIYQSNSLNQDSAVNELMANLKRDVIKERSRKKEYNTEIPKKQRDDLMSSYEHYLSDFKKSQGGYFNNEQYRAVLFAANGLTNRIDSLHRTDENNRQYQVSSADVRLLKNDYQRLDKALEDFKKSLNQKENDIFLSYAISGLSYAVKKDLDHLNPDQVLANETVNDVLTKARKNLNIGDELTGFKNKLESAHGRYTHSTQHFTDMMDSLEETLDIIDRHNNHQVSDADYKKGLEDLKAKVSEYATYKNGNMNGKVARERINLAYDLNNLLDTTLKEIESSKQTAAKNGAGKVRINGEALEREGNEAHREIGNLQPVNREIRNENQLGGNERAK